MSAKKIYEDEVLVTRNSTSAKSPGGRNKTQINTNGTLNISQRESDRFEDESEYLKNITSVIDLKEGIQHIMYSKGNRFFAVLVLVIESE